MPFLVAAEGDVAAVTRHCRAHTRLDQILDGGDGLGVLGVEEFIRRGIGSGSRRRQAAAHPTCSAP